MELLKLHSMDSIETHKTIYQLAYFLRIAAKEEAYDTFGREGGRYEKFPGCGREKDKTRCLGC